MVADRYLGLSFLMLWLIKKHTRFAPGAGPFF